MPAPPPEIPGQLLTCAPSPDVPGEGATQRDLALFILDLDAAGQDCRAKLGAVRGIVRTGGLAAYGGADKGEGMLRLSRRPAR